MDEIEVDFITYTKDQQSIVEGGINSIREVLNSTNIAEIRSLLFCLDKYLDPYYGYNLSYFDDIINLLQEHLFLNNDKRVKEDILTLLSQYGGNILDYLADNVEVLEADTDLLGEALWALGNTFNHKYIPILIRYKNHDNSIFRSIALEVLNFNYFGKY